MIAPTSVEAGATAQAMLKFAESFGARARHEVYVSMPITTGHAFIEWRRNSARSLPRSHPRYKEMHRQAVVDPNIARTASLVKLVQERFPDRLVINPGSMADIDGWEQPDYHYLWCATIAKYVQIVVFADGWQYSRGCVTEFVTAVESGLEILDQRLSPLHVREGNQMILDAVVSLDDIDEDTAELKESLEKLSRVQP